jgi:hypothetical protein
MSRRNSREALMQDDLLKVAEIGIAMQRTDLAERQFAAGVAQTIFAIDQQKKLEDTKMSVAQGLAELDPLSPTATERFKELQAIAGALPASERSELFRSAEIEMGGIRSWAEEYRTTYGIDPVVVDGRYDLTGSRRQAELIQGETKELNTQTLWTLQNDPTVRGAGLKNMVEIGKQHERASQMLEWAAREGVLNIPDGQSFDFNNPALFRSTVDPNDPNKRTIGAVYDPRAVEALRLKDGTTLGKYFQQAEQQTRVREQGTAQQKAIGSEIALLTDLVKIQGRDLYGAPEFGFSPIYDKDKDPERYNQALSIYESNKERLQKLTGGYGDAGAASVSGDANTLNYGNEQTIKDHPITPGAIQSYEAILAPEDFEALKAGKPVRVGNRNVIVQQ